MKISDILETYETDKNNATEHSYGEYYNKLFAQYAKESPISILELGVQRGGSLLAWKEYFPNAEVIGVDITDTRLEKYKQDRVTFIKADLMEAIPLLKDKYFDIIIDDADHFDGTNAFVVKNYYPLLKDGGVIVIEDIQIIDRYTQTIRAALPEGAVMSYCDLRHVKGRPDDYIITVSK